MRRATSIFGWKVALKNYGWKGFFLDSILPILISSFLCVVMYWKNTDIYAQLRHLVEVGIGVVPAMVALVLTAYTIMLTFIISDRFSSIKDTQKGKELIQSLNSSFAVCLLVSTISIIILVVISSIINMKIEMQNPNTINYFIFFLVCYSLIYSISILIGIVIDIFNSGQTMLLDDSNNSTENKK